MYMMYVTMSHLMLGMQLQKARQTILLCCNWPDFARYKTAAPRFHSYIFFSQPPLRGGGVKLTTGKIRETDFSHGASTQCCNKSCK
jgi:hypothetical protein